VGGWPALSSAEGRLGSYNARAEMPAAVAPRGVSGGPRKTPQVVKIVAMMLLD